jgi:nucleotide-binding universal stress UspA family protein
MSAERASETPLIVAGVDGSAPSREALHWAVRQAELTGASVDAVIAWQYPLMAAGYGWVPSGIDETDYEGLAAKKLDEAVSAVNPPPGVSVRQVVVEGNAAQAILDTAKHADLLVMGNRGHGGFADALIGSVSVNCLHHATCPVVIVRAHHPEH